MTIFFAEIWSPEELCGKKKREELQKKVFFSSVIETYTVCIDPTLSSMGQNRGSGSSDIH